MFVEPKAGGRVHKACSGRQLWLVARCKPHLRVKVNLPVAVNPASWQHKTIRLSPQSRERIYAGKPPRKGRQYESSPFSANGHIVREYCCGDMTATESGRGAKQRSAFYKTMMSVCSWMHQTLLSAHLFLVFMLHVRALNQGRLVKYRNVKGTVHQKLTIQPHADGKSGESFVVHKTFLRFRIDLKRCYFLPRHALLSLCTPTVCSLAATVKILVFKIMGIRSFHIHLGSQYHQKSEITKWAVWCHFNYFWVVNTLLKRVPSHVSCMKP